MNQPPGYPPGYNPSFQQPGQAPQQQAYGNPVNGQPQAYGQAPAYGQQPYAQPGMPGQQPGMQQPGMQPGMPGQPMQPGMQPGQPGQPGMQGPAMGFSLGSGGVRLNYKGGDFDPNNLIAGVMTGKGFGKPRVLGAGLFGLAVAFTIGNYALIHIINRFYPYLYSLAAIFSLGGLWLLVTGQPQSREDGAAAPTWGRMGLGACIALGVIMGIAMVILPWEAWL